jgi:hypothetical protein
MEEAPETAAETATGNLGIGTGGTGGTGTEIGMEVGGETTTTRGRGTTMEMATMTRGASGGIDEATQPFDQGKHHATNGQAEKFNGLLVGMHSDASSILLLLPHSPTRVSHFDTSARSPSALDQ